eukprot:scaffold40665_cov31-Tisochrysis_lutea.AAC.3
MTLCIRVQHRPFQEATVVICAVLVAHQPREAPSKRRAPTGAAIEDDARRSSLCIGQSVLAGGCTEEIRLGAVPKSTHMRERQQGPCHWRKEVAANVGGWAPLRPSRRGDASMRQVKGVVVTFAHKFTPRAHVGENSLARILGDCRACSARGGLARLA